MKIKSIKKYSYYKVELEDSEKNEVYSIHVLQTDEGKIIPMEEGDYYIMQKFGGNEKFNNEFEEKIKEQ